MNLDINRVTLLNIMARPLRIEYPNAVYHVMNRGRGRANVFHGKAYTDLFLQALAEAHQQFGLEILSYCLMSNHYHLLVRTPRGNLSSCMRHVNSVYTQRYNKLRRTDGALFRGRYKSILVEEDEYLLPVSRYIHRNPIETKTPMVKQLQQYALSSYPAYTNTAQTPTWLNKQFILSCMNTRQPTRAYKKYVLEGNNVTISNFYQKKYLPSVMGSKKFASTYKKHALAMDKEISGRKILNTLPINNVVKFIAEDFSVSVSEIITPSFGAKNKNQPRQIAMLLGKNYSGLTLPELADFFNVSSYSTVSVQARRLLLELEVDPTLARKVKAVDRKLKDALTSRVKI